MPGKEPFAVAGLWRPTDVWGKCYTMVMVPSSDQMTDVHDRMPVILRREDWDIWLDASPQDAFALCQTWAGPLEGERTDERWAGRRYAGAGQGAQTLPYAQTPSRLAFPL
jgi:hypothetical protein